MKTDGTKLRLLSVLKILTEYTDSENVLSAAEIIEKLSFYGITAERKAIYSDVEALCNAGYDVRVGASHKKGYYLASRTFSYPEVCLLVDAVQSAGFIPKDKTNELVSKLCGLTYGESANEIRNRICIENRSKSDNSEVYNIISSLNEAVLKRKKVKILYVKNGLNGNKVEVSLKEITVSPYALVWESDHYYLIANNAKYDNLLNLRIDRIKSVLMTNETVRHFSEVSEYKQRFDTADYVKKNFNMFGGSVCKIDLECKVDLLDQMLDRFGDEIFIRHFDGEEYFRFSVDAMLSEGFVGWLMNFGGDVRVLSPKDLKQRVLDKARALQNSLK